MLATGSNRITRGWTQDDEAIIEAAVQFLLHENKLQAAALLRDVHQIELEWEQGDWNTCLVGKLLVEPWLVNRFDERVQDEILHAVNVANYRSQNSIDFLRAVPVAGGEPGWREAIDKQLRDGPRNQATLKPLPPDHPRQDGMSFRDAAELAVYRALKSLQESLPSDDTFTIVPNPSVRIPSHTWEPDFLITYRKRCAAIEVDGNSHNGRWASDKSRDELLQDAGIAFVKRVDVRDAQNPAQARAFVERFISKLERS